MSERRSEAERETETDRERDRDRDIERQRQTDKERERQREADRQTDRQTDRRRRAVAQTGIYISDRHQTRVTAGTMSGTRALLHTCAASRQVAGHLL